MKLQSLVIIFIIIIIPIVLIFSLYLKLETKTITIQTNYDGKLIEATKEAVEAFEINTVEWNGKYSSLANLKRQDLMSSINVFTTSLANKLGIGGSSKENILTYIPAIVYIMYDGYYIYSPTYVPETITNENGVQLFYYKDSGSEGAKITASATQNIGGKIVDGEPIYVGTSKTENYNGEPITFTTDISNAEKEYKHVLKTFVPYTSIQDDYIINYTLDNYIRIYGAVQSKEGYVVKDTINVPLNSVSGISVNGETIRAEILKENIYVRKDLNEDAELKEYVYIYNSNNDKRYYDPIEGKFFMLNDKNVKVFLPEVTNVGHTLAEYKKLLVRTEETNYEYIELYQILNSDNNDTNWYYKDGKNQYFPYEVSIDGISDVSKEQDYSAINYYVETNNFNHWLKDNGINTEEILNGRKEAIIENINNNLNLSISNYNANPGIDYKIFELTDEDWEQALSNISMITFFQGIKTGLKTYNNYAIVTSTENNEYVSEDSLYYIGESDRYYHRYECDQAITNIKQAYRNTDFKVKSYGKEDEVAYYHKHKANLEEGAYECFDCIVNRNNYECESTDSYDQVFYTALARERYVQMSKINLIIKLNKTIKVIFDENGGSCSTKSKEVTFNSTYGSLPEATKSGREFAGWYTQKPEEKFITSSSKVAEKGDHTLYAHWYCTVTFNPNGGTCNIAEQKVIEGNKYGTLPEPTRTGYIFEGWYTAQTGGENVTATTTVPNTGNHTLYARWTPAKYIVTFDANGGTCAEPNRQVTYNNTYGDLPLPTKTYCTFDGWYTAKEGGEKVTEGTLMQRAENHTLYAHWTVNTYEIIFDVNGGSWTDGDPLEKLIAYNEQYGEMPTPTKSSSTFDGWYTAKEGGEKVTEGTLMQRAENHTLYAHWLYTFDVNKKINNVLEYSSDQGGSFDIYINGESKGTLDDFYKERECNYGTKVELKNMSAYDGYVYKGAEIYENGDMVEEINASSNVTVEITENISVVLKFEKIPDISFTATEDGGKSFNGKQAYMLADIPSRSGFTAEGKTSMIINATFKFNENTGFDGRT